MANSSARFWAPTAAQSTTAAPTQGLAMAGEDLTALATSETAGPAIETGRDPTAEAAAAVREVSQVFMMMTTTTTLCMTNCMVTIMPD